MDIQGDPGAVQNAIQAIQERFSGGYRGRDENRSSYNNQQSRGGYSQERSSNTGGRQESYKSSVVNDDDEWDNAPSMRAPQSGTYPLPRSSSYTPSANTYQQSSGTSFNDKPQSQSRYSDGNSYSGGGGGYSQDESRSSYSSGNRTSYRSYDDKPTTTNTCKTEDTYEPIDWDKANAECEAARKARWASCPKLVKDFYLEDPEVTNMSEEDVAKFREENKNIVVARTFADESSNEAMPKPTTKFEHAFSKFPDLMAEIKKAGFERPSPIQSQMWPILLSGEDCIGIAQTGTGKTLAFLLPALIHTDGQPHPRGIAARGGPNVLVLAPTRELAIQIEKEVGKYQFRGIRA